MPTVYILYTDLLFRSTDSKIDGCLSRKARTILSECIWYLQKALNNNWSRNVLVHKTESGLYKRQVSAEKVSNFERRLPSPQSEMEVQKEERQTSVFPGTATAITNRG